MTELRAEGLRSRTLIFAACLACAFVVLLGRLAYLQILKHDEYSRLAENQHAKTVPLRPKRGPILDRGGLTGGSDHELEALEGRDLDLLAGLERLAGLASSLPELAADRDEPVTPDLPVDAHEGVRADRGWPTADLHDLRQREHEERGYRAGDGQGHG